MKIAGCHSLIACTMTDFAAIDFETANGQRSSVCSGGVVIATKRRGKR
jgi:hypothetical protein